MVVKSLSSYLNGRNVGRSSLVLILNLKENSEAAKEENGGIQSTSPCEADSRVDRHSALPCRVFRAILLFIGFSISIFYLVFGNRDRFLDSQDQPLPLLRASLRVSTGLLSLGKGRA
jgi:hypothetical protein